MAASGRQAWSQEQEEAERSHIFNKYKAESKQSRARLYPLRARPQWRSSSWRLHQQCHHHPGTKCSNIRSPWDTFFIQTIFTLWPHRLSITTCLVHIKSSHNRDSMVRQESEAAGHIASVVKREMNPGIELTFSFSFRKFSRSPLTIMVGTSCRRYFRNDS